MEVRECGGGCDRMGGKKGKGEVVNGGGGGGEGGEEIGML